MSTAALNYIGTHCKCYSVHVYIYVLHYVVECRALWVSGTEPAAESYGSNLVRAKELRN